VVFNQIVAQLATVYPDLLNNIYVQDPIMDPEMETLFANHGCQVLEDPAAFEKVGAGSANTFFFPARLSMYLLTPLLRNKPYQNLAMFMGNGNSMLQDVNDYSQYSSTYMLIQLTQYSAHGSTIL
jgi:hypothetical protein